MELYVGNLPWSVTDEVLTNLFAAHGAVSRAKVVMDRETGRSRGFAFVTMTNAPEGQAAIQALNGFTAAVVTAAAVDTAAAKAAAKAADATNIKVFCRTHSQRSENPGAHCFYRSSLILNSNLKKRMGY